MQRNWDKKALSCKNGEATLLKCGPLIMHHLTRLKGNVPYTF